jgi:hypothetical protein
MDDNPNVMEDGPPVPASLSDDNLFGSPFVFAGFSSIIFFAESFTGEEMQDRMDLVCRLMFELEEDGQNRDDSLIYQTLSFERSRLAELIEALESKLGTGWWFKSYVEQSSDEMTLLCDEQGQKAVHESCIDRVRTGDETYWVFD